MYMPVCVSSSNFCEKLQFKMKCVEKYDASAFGASQFP